MSNDNSNKLSLHLNFSVHFNSQCIKEVTGQLVFGHLVITNQNSSLFVFKSVHEFNVKMVIVDDIGFL